MLLLFERSPVGGCAPVIEAEMEDGKRGNRDRSETSWGHLVALQHCSKQSARKAKDLLRSLTSSTEAGQPEHCAEFPSSSCSAPVCASGARIWRMRLTQTGLGTCLFSPKPAKSSFYFSTLLETHKFVHCVYYMLPQYSCQQTPPKPLDLSFFWHSQNFCNT